ncbi:WbqC family protein [Streptomyces niveus]|uniref:WbqC family protein n=1 Tax=Streptomyces niveus TaxID=193462 RepID=UPI00342204F6
MFLDRKSLWPRLWRWEEQAADRDGPFRLRFGTLFVADADAARDVLVDPAGNYLSQSGFFRLRRKSLLDEVRSEASRALLRVLARHDLSQWFDLDSALSEVTDGHGRLRHQYWGVGLVRRYFAPVIAHRRHTEINVLVDAYVTSSVVADDIVGHVLRRSPRTVPAIRAGLPGQLQFVVAAVLGPLGAPSRQQWLTIPTHLPQGRPTLIRDALITDPDLARRRTLGMLRQHFGPSPHWPALTNALDPAMDAFTTGKTAAVAETSTRILLDLVGWTGQILSSSQLPSRPGRSVRLADLAAATGARAYLCGTGGMTYLDPTPFAAQNITVAPFLPPTTGIWSSGRRLSALWALAAQGPDTVAARLRELTAQHGTSRIMVANWTT